MRVSSSIYRDIVYRAKDMLKEGRKSNAFIALRDLCNEHRSLGNLDSSVTPKHFLKKSYAFLSGKETDPYSNITEEMYPDGNNVVIL